MGKIPKLVVAGEHDHLTAAISLAVADSLGAHHIFVGRDWNLPGFGHVIPIEVGSEEVLARSFEWLVDAKIKLKSASN